MKTTLLTVAAILTILSSFAFCEVMNNDSVLRNGVTAHRGNSSEYPENTIQAFTSAIEVGADWIELDVLRSKDGKLVVIHDATTERVGDKKLVVSESSYEQLRSVDVATGFRRASGKSIEVVPKHTIPLLEDVLRLAMTKKRSRVSIQPKTDCVADAIRLVKQMGAEEWVGFNDGNLEYMSEVKRLAPQIPVFWDRGESDIDSDIRIAKQHGFESLVLHYSAVTEEKVKKIHGAAIEAGAWTVNDQTVMAKMLSVGADRIYTDFPERLLQLRNRRFCAAKCEGTYPHHLQGICTNDCDAIYWSFTTNLVKTDTQGNILKKIPVANHHGDLCHVTGRLYVAVNLGKFNDPAGNADSWVYAYDADDLTFLAKYEVQQVVHGAGGIDFCDGHFYVVGGLPPGANVNYVYEYDDKFRFIKRHDIQSGYTLMGIQTAAHVDGQWWFGCYGVPRVTLKTDSEFQVLGKYKLDCSLGIVGVSNGQLLVASGPCKAGKGCKGSVMISLEDAEHGLAPLKR